MNSFRKKILRLLNAEDGPTTVQYAMMVLLLALACLTAVTFVGQSGRSVGDPNTSIPHTAETGD